MGFFAGDQNLYCYVGNSPTNLTDPSGLKVDRSTLPGHIPSLPEPACPLTEPTLGLPLPPTVERPGDLFQNKDPVNERLLQEKMKALADVRSNLSAKRSEREDAQRVAALLQEALKEFGPNDDLLRSLAIQRSTIAGLTDEINALTTNVTTLETEIARLRRNQR